MDRLIALHESQRQSRTGLAGAFCVLTLAALASGCVDSSMSPQAETLQTAAGRVALDGVSGASVALASLSGVPQPVEDRLTEAFTKEAAARDVTLVDAKKADYLIRGYVTAYQTETGTAVSLVYDVFDAKKKRAQRLEEGVVIKTAAAADPWSSVDAAAISNLAAKSADELAAFLATTPEALAKSQSASATAANEPPARSAPEAGEIRQTATPAPGASASKAGDVNVAALH